jgi:hypothetical protein
MSDDNFSGNWTREEGLEHSDTARSRTGYIVAFLGCPITWKSQLQTEIAPSSCESEYIALSQALRKVIPIMHLIQEMKAYHHHDKIKPSATNSPHCETLLPWQHLHLSRQD